MHGDDASRRRLGRSYQTSKVVAVMRIGNATSVMALSGTAASGTYCMRAYDGGHIPAGVTDNSTVPVQDY